MKERGKSSEIRWRLPWLLSQVILAGTLATQAQVSPGTALDLDGGDAHVEVPSTSPLNAFPLTITAWIRTSQTRATYDGIVSKYFRGSGNGFSLHLYNGRLSAWYFRGGGNFIYNGDPGLDGGFVADGFWHHVAFIVGTNGGQLYVDGALQNSLAWTGAAGAPTSAQPLKLGRYDDAAVFPNAFAGQLDEITLWNRALDSSELNYLKHRQLIGNEDDLVALWHFDEGANSTARDATGHGHDGTLVSAPTWITSTAPLAFKAVAGTALKFDGGDDFVQVPHAASLNAYPMTVMAWARTTRNASIVDGIVSKYGESSLNGFSLYLLSGRVRAWYFRDGSNRIWDGAQGIDGGPIADGSWHHLALVVDGTGGRIYKDGLQTGFLNWTGNAGPPTTFTNLQFGKYWSYNNSLTGALDEVSIWSQALSPAQINAFKNVALTGAEPGLVGLWRFSEGTGTKAADLTGHGHDGTLLNGPAWIGSTAFLGDGTSAIHTTMGPVNWSRTYAIQTVPSQLGFTASIPILVRRLDDFGASIAPMNATVKVHGDLNGALSGAVPLDISETNLDVTMNPFNAAVPPISSGPVSLTPALNVQPAGGIQLDSVNDSFRLDITESHSVAAGPFTVDDNIELGPTNLLHFNGNLYFGPVLATFSNLLFTPLINGIAPPDYLVTSLKPAVGSGRLAARPDITFGGGFSTILTVHLLPNGDAIDVNGVYFLNQPANTFFEMAGIRYALINASLSPSGAAARELRAFFPSGFGMQLSPDVRLQYPYATSANVVLDGSLAPVAPVLTFTASAYQTNSLYFSEETKPLLIGAPQIEWHVADGEFLIDPVTSVRFTRKTEDDLLAAARPNLMDPTAADRISNDGYFANASPGPSPVVVRADANGAALLSMQVALGAVDLRPHFPYTSESISGHIPVTDGLMVIADDLVDGATSYLNLAGPVPVAYTRTCANAGCSGSPIAPEILQFTAGADQLRFTLDGGLLAYGAVPSQNLTWGHLSGDDFAQRTSDVDAGAFHIPGTFLRGDQTALDDAQRPAVILFSGFGDASNPAYFERPYDAAYFDGFANYAGLNFRAPAQGRSIIAKQDTGWYELVPEVKYYTRFGGVSGIHQAATFPDKLTLYGYTFDFTRYALSYLDSENYQSRTDGSIVLPYPSDFTQEFEQMKFLCLGDLDSARIPAASGEKWMNYWNTYITPRSLQFKPLSNDVCNVGPRFLVLGVETKLPFIPEALQAALCFKPDGNLATVADQVQGVDSRFPVPGQLSLQGPGNSHFNLGTASEGYFNSYTASGQPDAGFFNLIGKLDLPFFEDSKVHLHVKPTGRDTAEIKIMGGWRAADKFTQDRGWTDRTQNFFNTPKFDAIHRGFPDRPGLTIFQYRDSDTADYHPRAQREWIEVATFDYPLSWNATLRSFSSFESAPVELPVINVNSNLRELTPGKVDLDFAQDIELKLPRLKLLDLANDAVDEINAPLNSLSNAVSQALGDATGLTKGFRSLQRVLRDDAQGFFRPVLEPTLDPVVEQLYSQLSTKLATDPANFAADVASLTASPGVGLKNAIRNINGAGAQANSVAGQLSQVMTDVDDTLGLFLRVLEKDGGGNRHIVRLILQKLVEDQGPVLKLIGNIGETLANQLLGDLEPTLAQVESKLRETRAEFNNLQAQLGDASGQFNQALGTVTANTPALDQFVLLASAGMSNLMATVVTSSGDYFTANPAEARRAIRERLIVSFLSSSIPAKYQQTFKQYVYDDDALLNQLMETLFQQINQSIRNGLASQLGTAQDRGFLGMKGPPNLGGSLAAAQIRGSPTFNGDALKKIRLDAKVRMKLADEMTFNAFMEIKELDSQSTPLDCIPPGDPAAEVIIGATDVPLDWAGISPTPGSQLTLTVEARWTLQKGTVLGVGGLLDVKGEVGFKGCSVKEIGAALAIGAQENYFAAKAAGTILILGIPVDVKTGIFVGHACSLDPLNFVDPDASHVLDNPIEFRGIYLEYGGGLSLSEILFGTSNCYLDVDASITTALFYQDGPRSGRIGMRQKEALDLSLLCVISGHVDVALFGSLAKTPSGYELILGGEANLCGELGYCPLCVEGCKGITIEGVVRDGGIDYHVHF